jgi:1,4-dihydroxy-2-naphthoate octaprenyltransferase
MITTVWALATALLPAINISFPLGNYQLWLTIAERVIFIFILALCFDARDVEFDGRDNLKTIPIRYGPESISLFYKILCAVFIVIVCLHYFVLTHLWGIGVVMIVSIILTYLTVIKTYPRKSDYYYMFIVDGMMMAQFLLMWIMVHVV